MVSSQINLLIIMKQFITGIFVISFFSVAGYAQSSSLWLGVHGGADMGIISTNNPFSGTITAKTGIAIGAVAEYWISDNASISFQPAYVQKGANDKILGNTYILTYRYLQLPVLMKATFGSGPVQPFFFAGPEIGVKLSVSESGKIFDKDTNVVLADSLITKFNMGILIGAGITYAVAPETVVFLQAGYNYGLTNINVYEAMHKAFTRDIRANLGVLFRIE